MAADNPTQNQRVELGKQTRKEILDALKNIKAQISTARQRESTPSDVAADVLASGGGAFAAAKEALSFKAGKTKSGLKRRFDPLNIVNRMTGGSKLATVLAGKVMGRSQSSIRSAAGLQPSAEARTDSPTLMDSAPESHGPTPTDQSLKLFDKMAKALVLITARVTDIAVKMNATKNLRVTKGGRIRDMNTGQFAGREEMKQTELLKELVKFATEENAENDRARDASKESDYESRFGKKMSPTRMGASGPAQEGAPKKGGWLEWIWGLLSGIVPEFIGGITGALLASGKKLGSLLIEGVMAMKSKIADFMESSWEAIKSFGGKIGKGAEFLAEKAKGIGTGLLEMAGIRKATPVPTVEPTTPKPPVKAPIPSKVPGGAMQIPKPDAKKTIAKLGPKLLGKVAAKAIPLVGFATALSSLIQGDLTQAAIDAGMGVASMIPGVGTMSSLAAGMVGTLINSAYKDMYGIDPLSDPERGERLPELASAAKDYVAATILPKAEVMNQIDAKADVSGVGPAGIPQSSASIQVAAATPTELSVPKPSTGLSLQAAADMRSANEGQATMAMPMASPTITNVKNSNIQSTMINQTIASPRSGESSFLRTVDRNYSIA